MLTVLSVIISCWVPSVMFFFCSAEELLVGGPWRMFCSGFHRWKPWSAVQCGLSPAVAVGWPGLQCPTAQRCPGLAPPRPAVHHHCGLAHHSPAASVSRPGASGEVIHRRKHQVSIYSTHKLEGKSWNCWFTFSRAHKKVVGWCLGSVKAWVRSGLQGLSEVALGSPDLV